MLMLPGLLVLRLVLKLELLQAGCSAEAMGPLQVGRVLAEALASAVLASSGASLAVLRAGSEAMDPWLAEQLAWAWLLPVDAVAEVDGPAVVVLVVEQLLAAWLGLVAGPGSLNLLPGRHWHNRQSSTMHCLCNQHLPVLHSNSLRFCPGTVLWATDPVVTLDTNPVLVLEVELEVLKLLQIDLG